MTYVIAEPCIDVLDLSCVSVCPVDCIHYDEGTDRKLFIDPNECIDCGACEPECPVNAIFPEESLPPEWANYTPIDAIWYTDKAAAAPRSTSSSRAVCGLTEQAPEHLAALDFLALGAAQQAADVVAGLALVEQLAEHLDAGDDGLAASA